MPDLIVPGPVDGERGVREAVCIHTKRVTDSCRDKDCLDCMRVYPTRSSQAVLDRAMSVKAGCAQLLCAYIDVEPVSFNRGFYAVDVRYCYRITADAFVGAGRPVEITGLAVFDKRVILYGGEGGPKVFTSITPCHLGCPGAPEAVVDTVAYKLPPRSWLQRCEKRKSWMLLEGITLFHEKRRETDGWICLPLSGWEVKRGQGKSAQRVVFCGVKRYNLIVILCKIIPFSAV